MKTLFLTLALLMLAPAAWAQTDGDTNGELYPDATPTETFTERGAFTIKAYYLCADYDDNEATCSEFDTQGNTPSSENAPAQQRFGQGNYVRFSIVKTTGCSANPSVQIVGFEATGTAFTTVAPPVHEITTLTKNGISSHTLASPTFRYYGVNVDTSTDTSCTDLEVAVFFYYAK